MSTCSASYDDPVVVSENGEIHTKEDNITVVGKGIYFIKFGYGIKVVFIK